jgi:hypothetical protein
LTKFADTQVLLSPHIQRINFMAAPANCTGNHLGQSVLQFVQQFRVPVKKPK